MRDVETDSQICGAVPHEMGKARTYIILCGTGLIKMRTIFDGPGGSNEIFKWLRNDPMMLHNTSTDIFHWKPEKDIHHQDVVWHTEVKRQWVVKSAVIGEGDKMMEKEQFIQP